MNSKTVVVDQTTAVMLLPANNARRGYKVTNVDGGTNPLLVRTAKVPVTSGVAGVIDFIYSATPTAGNLSISNDQGEVVTIAHNSNNTAIQTELRKIPGLGSVTVAGRPGSAPGFRVTMTGAGVPNPRFNLSANTLRVAGQGDELELGAYETPAGIAITPASGTFRMQALLSGGIVMRSGLIPYNVADAELQAALRAAFADQTIVVTGDWSNGFEIDSAAARRPHIFSVVENEMRFNAVEEQTIIFSETPDSGTYTVEVEGVGTSDAIAATANAAAVQAAIRAIDASLVAVTVSDTTGGFFVRFVGVTGPQPLLTVVGASLEDDQSDPVVITVDRILAGEQGARYIPQLSVVQFAEPDDGVSVQTSIATLADSTLLHTSLAGAESVEGLSKQAIFAYSVDAAITAKVDEF